MSVAELVLAQQEALVFFLHDDKVCLDELPNSFDLLGSLHNDAGAAQVGHLVDGVGVLVELAGDLLAKLEMLLGGTGSGVGKRHPAGLFQDTIQDLRVHLVVRAFLAVRLDLPLVLGRCKLFFLSHVMPSFPIVARVLSAQRRPTVV